MRLGGDGWGEAGNENFQLEVGDHYSGSKSVPTGRVNLKKLSVFSPVDDLSHLFYLHLHLAVTFFINILICEYCFETAFKRYHK